MRPSSLKRNFIHLVQFTTLLLALLLAVFLTPRPLSSLFAPADSMLLLPGADAFGKLLKNNRATINDIRQGADALDFRAMNLPADLAHLPLEKRKNHFITLVLSHAIQANARILHERKKLILYSLDLRSGKFISPQRKLRLKLLARRYNTSLENTEELLRRIDIIPVSLAIAQAIQESGWGTSRFALHGNALYGQHRPRDSKKKYILSQYGNVKVAAFDSLLQATSSYMHNLNTSAAYSSLRHIRAGLREQSRIPDGISLTAGLRYYSELGEEYIRDIRFLIEQHDLSSLEDASFDKNATALVIRFQHNNISLHDVALSNAAESTGIGNH
ncbi:MAG: glucosaminidase domain-containing protein [Desulfopila sp.]|jgi:uncharacterized FlgJ-related protein|nr:glucosaminidase domain-containing protein [Desulfopila sp.]